MHQSGFMHFEIEHFFFFLIIKRKWMMESECQSRSRFCFQQMPDIYAQN